MIGGRREKVGDDKERIQCGKGGGGEETRWKKGEYNKWIRVEEE